MVQVQGRIATKCGVVDPLEVQEEKENKCALTELEPGVFHLGFAIVKQVAHCDAMATLAELVKRESATVDIVQHAESNEIHIAFTLLPLNIPHILLKDIAPYCCSSSSMATGKLTSSEAPEYTVESCFSITAQVRHEAMQRQMEKQPTLHGELENLPDALLLLVLGYLSARDLKQVRKTSLRMYVAGMQVQPAWLETKLFPHQLRSLNMMEQQEVKPPEFDLSIKLAENCFMDLCTGALTYEKPSTYCAKRGGLFCDQPGLGKTCTVLALILRSRGMLAHESLNQHGECTALREKRKSPSRSKLVEKEDRLNGLVGVKTTLIIVPRPLLPHWHSQIALHAPKLSFASVDETEQVPGAEKIGALDILLVSFNQISYQARLGVDSFLHSVLFLRCVVDEGHSLGVATSETNYSIMLKELRCERIWIMTGTPAKMTNKAQSLRSLGQILGFLHATPPPTPGAQFRPLDLIAKNFQNEQSPWSFYMLSLYLLAPVLIRHTKEEIMNQLPALQRVDTTIELDDAEKRQYNILVAFIEINLLLTTIGDKKAGWDQSLLNPIHHAKAFETIEMLRVACTAGAIEAFRLRLREANRVETLKLFAQEPDEVKETVDQFLLRASNRERTACSKCLIEYDFVLITRCGHFICPECFSSSQCVACAKEIDLDDFAYLQPGFDLDRFVDNSIKHASKADYLINRIKDERAINPKAKFIVFSQFRIVLNYIGDSLINAFGADSVAEFWGQYRKFELKKFNTGMVEAWKCPTCKRINPDLVAKTCGLPIAILDNNIRVLTPELLIENWTAQPVVGSTVRFLDGVTPAARLLRVGACRGRRNQAAEIEHRQVHCDILLLSKDGAVGLDISSATHVFLTDYIWDLSLEDQIVSRAWRLGNKSRAVCVERLLVKDTVEEVLKDFSSGNNSTGGDNDARVKIVLGQVKLLK